MAHVSGTGAVVRPTRRSFRDGVKMARSLGQEVDLGASPIQAEVQAPKLTPTGRQSANLHAAVGKAAKASPRRSSKRAGINDVAQQALIAHKRDPQDRTRIIMCSARQIKDNCAPTDEHPSYISDRKSNARASLQCVATATKQYFRQKETTSTFKANLFESRLPAVLGSLLKEDISADRLKTTLESLVTEEPCEESIAHRLRAMSAKLDEIKGIEDRCSSVIDRARLIPGAVAEAFASDPESSRALEAELEVSQATLIELGSLLRSLEHEYDWFRKTFASFQPTFLPVCFAGHTLIRKKVPQDQTVVCEECHIPSRKPLAKDLDPAATDKIELSWKRNFQVMWQCPACIKECPIYLCLPCGKARFNPGDRWLSCLSLSSEWDHVKADAHNAIARITLTQQLERWKNGEEKEQEDAEEEQEKHEDKDNDDNKENVAKVQPARPMNPTPISTGDASLPCSSLPYSSEDGHRMRTSPTMTNNSAPGQSPTLGPPPISTADASLPCSSLPYSLEDGHRMRASPTMTYNSASGQSPTSGPPPISTAEASLPCSSLPYSSEDGHRMRANPTMTNNSASGQSPTSGPPPNSTEDVSLPCSSLPHCSEERHRMRAIPSMTNNSASGQSPTSELPPISTEDVSLPCSSLPHCSEERHRMRASPSMTDNSASGQSPTLEPLCEPSRRSPTSGSACEEGEQSSDCLLDTVETSEVQSVRTHPNLTVFSGPFAPFPHRSATPQPATKSSPKSGRQSAQGHRIASSSRSSQRDGNLAGFVVTSTSNAFSEKAWRGRGSGANPLNIQEMLEEKIDALSKHSPTPRRSSLLSLELPAAEPRQPCVGPRPKLLSSPKDPKDSSSSARRSLVHQQLVTGRASTPNNQVMRRRTDPAPISRASCGPGAQFKSVHEWLTCGPAVKPR